MRRTLACLSSLLLLLAGACGSSHSAPLADAGSDSTTDSSSALDGTVPPSDATVPPSDATVPPSDATAPPADATVPPPDGAPPPADSAVPPSDGGSPTVPGGVGSACTMDTDCDMLTGAMCMTTLGSGGFSFDFPGGYCTQSCTPSFGGAPDDCPAGSSCFGGGFGGAGAAFCAKTCASDADCRSADGYTCMSPPFGGGPSVCAPPFGGGGMMGGDSGLPFP